LGVVKTEENENPAFYGTQNRGIQICTVDFARPMLLGKLLCGFAGPLCVCPENVDWLTLRR